MKTVMGGFRAGRVIAAGVTIVAALAAIVAVSGPRIIRGPRFGRLVERFLPATRGQIHVGGGSWTWGAVIGWVRERSAHFELEDVRVIDPEGIEVLAVARLSGQVSVPRDTRDVVVRELRIETATWRFADMKRGGVGFLAALEPRGPQSPRSGPKDKVVPRPGGLSIRDATLDGVGVTFDLRAWGLVLDDVHGVGSLSLSTREGKQSFAFEVRDADARRGGRLRILRGDAALALPFARARLDRVATTAAAPDALRLEASGIATGASVATLATTFTGVYGISRPRAEPGLDLHVEISDAADAIASVASSRGWQWPPALAGRGAGLALDFAGPFAHLQVGARTSLVSPDGGTCAGTLKVDDRALAIELSFARFATTPFLPGPLAALAGGTLQGAARGGFDWRTRSASMEQVDLTLTRSAPEARPRIVHVRAGPPGPREPGPHTGHPSEWALSVSGARFAAGTLRLPRLTAGLWGGRLSASGRITLTDGTQSRLLARPTVDLTLGAARLSMKSLLGSAFVEGDVSFRARARGAIDDLSVDVLVPAGRELRVLGERFVLPEKIKLHLRDQDLLIAPVTLRGPRASALSISGRIDLKGGINLDVGAEAFPLERLPGLAETALPLAGRLSGHLTLSGPVGQPALAGQLSFDPVTFQGRRVGGGLITISPGPHGAMHAHGRLVEGIDADGTLLLAPGGLTGDATLTLRQLRLDPFLAALPGGVTASGLLSGKLMAHISPGHPARAEARLDQLTLTVKAPSRLARSNHLVRPIDLHSEGEIRLSAEAGAGPIRFGPARFAGNLGAFEIEGESRGNAVSGALRGRVLLDAFAPLTAAWVDDLTGALDIRLRAAQAGPGAPFLATGDITIAAPLSGRARAVSLQTRIASGQIRLLGDAVETTALPITFDGVAGGPIRRARGAATVTARVGITPAEPTLQATIDLARIELDAPSAGREPITISGGRIEAADRTFTLRDIPIRFGQQVRLTLGGKSGPPAVAVVDSIHTWNIARLDLPFDGELRAIAKNGIRIDQARFALRLQGQPRGALLLAGDVDVTDAQIPADLGRGGLGRGPTDSKASAPAIGPELERMRLDLHVHSRPGGVEVNVRHAPDLHVGVDYHIGGTLKHPDASGQIRGAGAYSVFVLWLGRLLK